MRRKQSDLVDYMVMVRKFVFALLLCAVLGGGVGFSWHTLRAGFDIRRISYLPKPAISVSVSPELHKILQQPFFYFARGRQSFAFVSQDGQYVLKLPRSDLPKLAFWKKSLFPEKSWRASGEKKQLRRKKALESFQMAYEELKEETGLIYLHLSRTEGLPTVEIIDAAHRHHRVALDQTLFFVQKRYPLAFPELQERFQRGDTAGIEQFLEAFLEMAYRRAKKGIFNSDSEFLMNFGIEGDQIYQIDIGSFRKSEQAPEKIFALCFLDTASQLKKRLPLEWARWVDKRVEARLAREQ